MHGELTSQTMNTSDVAHNIEGIIEPMIALGRCSIRHRIVVSGMRSAELMFELHRRGHERVETTASCSFTAGPHDVAPVIASSNQSIVLKRRVRRGGPRNPGGYLRRIVGGISDAIVRVATSVPGGSTHISAFKVVTAVGLYPRRSVSRLVWVELQNPWLESRCPWRLPLADSIRRSTPAWVRCSRVRSSALAADRCNGFG
jgi:hypothetical protein